MRVFELVSPMRVKSNDGISIYSVNLFKSRYERPDKYCDLNTDGVFNGRKCIGTAYSLASDWIFPDGQDTPITVEEMKAIKLAAFGSKAYFEGNLENVEID
jgi:hypothetical protein